MKKEIQLERFKRDKLTKEKTLVPFFIYKEDIACLYRDIGGTFITTKQGYYNEVPYEFEDLRKCLGL